MPLKIDLLDGAELETDDQGLLRVTRSFLAYGLETSQPWKVLYNALIAQGVPPTGAGWPGNPNLGVVRHLIRSTKMTDGAKGFVIYERVFDPLTQGTGIVIDDSTHLSQEMVSIDRSFSPTRVTYTTPVSGSNGGTRYTKSADLPKLVPVRTLSATGVVRAPVPLGVLKAAGTVNASPWQGLPRGWWLFLGARVNNVGIATSSNLTTSKPSKTDEVQLQFLTRNRDWSEYAVYREQGGSIPQITGFGTISGSGYGQGDGWAPSYNGTANGIAKYSLYEESNFGALFPGLK